MIEEATYNNSSYYKPIGGIRQSRLQSLWIQASKKLNRGQNVELDTELPEGRSYRVRVQNKASQIYPTSSSTPQGSQFSPSFFNYILFDIPQAKVDTLIYADDITLCFIKDTLEEALSTFQEAINENAKWCSENGQEVNA